MTQRVVTVSVLVMALVALWQYWPSDERRIQLLVQQMATALQPAPEETDSARATRLAPLTRGISPDIVVEGPTPVRGREHVLAAAMQAGRLAPELSIVVRDIDVRVEPGSTTATALVTVAIGGVTSAGSGGWDDISELQLDLTRQDDVWLVSRVAPVAVLRP